MDKRDKVQFYLGDNKSLGKQIIRHNLIQLLCRYRSPPLPPAAAALPPSGPAISSQLDDDATAVEWVCSAARVDVSRVSSSQATDTALIITLLQVLLLLFCCQKRGRSRGGRFSPPINGHNKPTKHSPEELHPSIHPSSDRGRKKKKNRRRRSIF